MMKIIHLGFIFASVQTFQTGIEILTDKFFDNLRSHPRLIGTDLNVSKQVIDNQITNYVNLVIGKQSNSIKKKRSLLDKFTKHDEGIYILDEIKASATVPVRFSEDILLFEQDFQWFAATLESPNLKENANYLVIFAFENETFIEKHRVSVVNGSKISVINLENSTILAVAETDAPKTNFHNKSGIYQFDKSGLFKIQSIDMHYASDIALWRIHNEIYMSIAQFMSNDEGNIHYEIEIPVYKWLGKHFDLVQNLKSKGARKITPFRVDNGNFLAVANSRDDAGNSKVYSDIYKYDYHSEKYELYQRILTRACMDIEVFNLKNSGKKDTFLVVANSYQKDFEGNVDYETDSIIYKLIDNYFVPFQSFKLKTAEQWLPVQGPNLEFVLFVSTRFDGIKSFQYDGWSFMEVPQKTPNILTGEGINSLRYTHFKNSTLVVSNKNNNGKSANIFKLEFTHQKILKAIYDEMNSWCDQGLQKVEELGNGELFEAMLGQPARADTEDDEDLEVEENREVQDKIDQLQSLLNQIKINTPPEEIAADEIIFNNVTFVSNLNATKVNNFEMDDLLSNVIDIDEDLDFDKISLSSIKIENSLEPKNINGHDIDTLLHSTDDFSLNSVKIQGTLTVPEGINIQGQLNGVSVDENLLQTTGDQQFSHVLKSKEVRVGKIFAKSLNGQTLSSQFKNEKATIDHIENLTVKNLTIGGYVNDVDIPTLDKYSLKKSGDQVLTSEFVFDSIQGKNLEVLGNISRRKLTDLVPIDGGNFSINQDLIFTSDLFVNNLEIIQSLNGIRVHDGKLDVLLNDTEEEQEITGEKMFDDIVIYKAITLHGRINSKNLEKMNPVISIDENVFLQGDKTVTGLLLVEGFVNAKDITTSGGTYSLSKLESEGLRLSTKKVRPHLLFVQQLNVDEVFVETINGKKAENFVVLGTNDPQIISGPKTFLGDLYVDGTSHALKIKETDVEELENSILKLEGDQTIVGKHHIEHVIAERISTNETVFDENLKSTAENGENVTIHDDFEVNVVKVDRIWVRGLVNDLPFDDIVDDTVPKNTQNVIEGHKHFKNLTIANLEAQVGVEIDEVPDQIDNLELEGPLTIDNTKIGNIYFGDKCNGVDKEKFGQFLSENGTTVPGDREFDSLLIYGNAFIASNKLNNLDIFDLANETVKLDEPFEFKSAIFETEIVAKTPVELEGNVENLDFDNVVTSSTSESIIFEEKIFIDSLTIDGMVNFESFVNNFNMSKLCKLTMGEMEEKNLTITGHAFFTKGPRLGKINNLSVKAIKDNAWFGNEDTTLTGSIDFEDIIFKNDVEVGGFVDNVSLKLVYENYFSKSKDQNITAIFSFESNLTFENNVTVPTIIVDGGEVNGIKLEEFVRTAILNDFDQVFESVVFFEKCHIQNLTGEFTVNGFDLANDVMRYDKVNMVTGTKIFENLNVDHLKLDKNIKIQEVDVLDWFKNSVLKTTSFNITGNKSFRNAFFANGFQLGGALNGLKWDKDNIMLKDVPQEITGLKTIVSRPVNPVTFKGIKLKGLLNDVEVFDLINNHAYRNKDNVFKTSLNFYNEITTNNLVIEKLYRGVNMTELISNVTNLGVLNNLLGHYKDLLDMSYKLKESIRGQAYFVDYYKIIQKIPSASNSQIIVCPDGVKKIGILISEDSGTRMDLYAWYHQAQKFVINATIHFADHPQYVEQVLGGYLYAEGIDGKGHFIPMTSLENSITISTNTTIYTTSFVVPTTNEPCTLFIYRNSPPRIFCTSQKENEILLKQILEAPNAFRASSVTIESTLYLIILTQGEESRTDFWKFNNQTSYFEFYQSMFEAYPKCASTVSYKNSHYLAIASGHIQNSMYSGSVEIRRFDEATHQFTPWQSLELDAPIQVEFSVLPSNELVLYVLTDDPTESLLVFRYEGIAKFNLFITGSALPRISYLNQFVGGAGHFLVAQSHGEINIIQAIFKGEKVAE